MIRAVIDLNVIISALIIARGTPFEIWSAWQSNRFTLVISEGMILELTGKLSEPRIAQKYSISADAASFTAALLRTQANLVTVSENQVPAVTGDPEDDLVLATAHLGRADYLVTGDKKLLGLQEHERVTIIRPSEFITIMKEYK